MVERPSCSSTRNHSVLVQPWPPCSGACRPPDRRASIASRLMRCLSSSGDLAAVALGLLLVGDQDVLDEAPRAFLEVELLGREVCGGGRGGRRGSDGHAVPPGSPSLRLSWFELRRATSSRASATSSSALAGARKRGRLGDVRRPRTPAAARDQALHPLPLRRDRGPVRACPQRAAWRSAAGSSRSGSGVMESHAWRVRVGPHRAAWYHATDHKVRTPFWRPLKPLSAPPHCPPGSTATRAVAELELRAHLRAHLAVRGARRRACPTPAATSPPAPAASRCSCCATRTACCAPSATSAATAARACWPGSGELRQGDPLPLPRLDLPARRRADRRARGALDPGPRQVARSASSRCASRRSRGLVFVNLDVRRHAAGRADRGACRAAGALRHRGPRAAPAAGRRRSRPTGRSSPTTTSRATTCRSPIPG